MGLFPEPRQAAEGGGDRETGSLGRARRPGPQREELSALRLPEARALGIGAGQAPSSKHTYGFIQSPPWSFRYRHCTDEEMGAPTLGGPPACGWQSQDGTRVIGLRAQAFNHTL